MGEPHWHIANGLEAVIDSANAVLAEDVWVDVEDLPNALRQIDKLKNDPLYKPEVYAGREGSYVADKSVCLRL